MVENMTNESHTPPSSSSSKEELTTKQNEINKYSNNTILAQTSSFQYESLHRSVQHLSF